MLKQTLNVFLSLALLTGVAMADDEITGTITLEGILAPKAISIGYSLIDCGATATEATCKNTLEGATFTVNHVQHASINLGNIAENGNNVRYVQFEAKTKLVLFKGDYLQFKASLIGSETQNDVKVTLKKLIFVRGGTSTLGQTTLGAPGQQLVLNQALISTDYELLADTVTTIWNQLSIPGVANNKVFFAAADGNELIVRGVLAIEFGADATSSNFKAKINAGFIAKDGN